MLLSLEKDPEECSLERMGFEKAPVFDHDRAVHFDMPVRCNIGRSCVFY